MIERMPVFLGEKVVWLSLDEILYLKASGHRVRIQTLDNIYRPPQSLQDLHKILQPLGFEEFSRNALGRVDKIILWDEKSKTAYFDKDREIAGLKVSRTNLKIIGY